MNLITPDSGLLFWMVLIFGIVFFILAKWGVPAITGMVEKRNDHISSSLTLAEEARRSIARLEEEQAAMIRSTRQEQAQILKEAAKAREEILLQAKEDARRETAEMIAAARAQIENERETAMRDLRRQVAVVSVEVAEKVLRDKLRPDSAQQALLDRLVDEASSAKLTDKTNN